MLTHVVMMKFKPEVTDMQIDTLEKHLNTLSNIIVEIQSNQFGRNAAPSVYAYDFSLIMTFANIEALNHYRTHPEHIKLANELKKIFSAL